jgi:hypothetical protein
MLLGPTFTCCLSLFYVEDTPTAVLCDKHSALLRNPRRRGPLPSWRRPGNGSALRKASVVRDGPEAVAWPSARPGSASVKKDRELVAPHMIAGKVFAKRMCGHFRRRLLDHVVRGQFQVVERRLQAAGFVDAGSSTMPAPLLNTIWSRVRIHGWLREPAFRLARRSRQWIAQQKAA